MPSQFLSTLSLRRATNSETQSDPVKSISIHALLAESDKLVRMLNGPHSKFLSTLSLRRATQKSSSKTHDRHISIHALLAESDLNQIQPRRFHYHFYPRSPCGERQPTAGRDNKNNVFLSTLSLRRATRADSLAHAPPQISIHALLAESDRAELNIRQIQKIISIHALLAESDRQSIQKAVNMPNFYPRSPCGERRLEFCDTAQHTYFYPRSPCGERPTAKNGSTRSNDFYPRSPCGERLFEEQTGQESNVISIHALLAESDVSTTIITICTALFLSTLSLRRATSSGFNF